MPNHTVKSFDVELGHLRDIIVEMGKLAHDQLEAALQALVERDNDLAKKVIAEDIRIDALETETQNLTIRLLALRQPMAGDLRHIIAALKVSSEMERVGDYAANVAKRTLILNDLQEVPAVAGIVNLGKQVLAMLDNLVLAYDDGDAEKAVEVWNADESVDQLYTSLFREILTYMMEDQTTITSCIHLMFMAKNIERIGDHMTNIAESLYFLIKGVTLDGDRPKGGDEWGKP